MKKLIITLLVYLVFSTNTYAYWEELQVHGEKPVRAFICVGDYLFASTINSGVYFSSDNGDTWEKRDNGLDGYEVTAFAYNGKYLFAGTQFNGVFYSTNYGETWLPRNSDIEQIMVYSLAVSSDTIVMGSAGIYLSTDSGGTWELILEGRAENINTIYNEVAIVNNVVYGGAGILGQGLFGASLNNLEESIFRPSQLSGQVYSLLIINQNIFVSIWGSSFGSGIYHTSNYGETWENRSSGISEVVVSSLELINNKILAGTRYKGLYISDDLGESWRLRNVGLRDDAYISNFSYNDKYIFAGSFKYLRGNSFEENYIGSNFYRAKREAITSLEEQVIVKGGISSYPNPTRDIQHIRTDELISRAELSDLLGNVVIRDLTPTLSKGEGVSINVESLPAGMYFLKLYTSSGEILVEKVIVGF